MPPSFALVIVTHNSAPWLPRFADTWHTTVGGLENHPAKIEIHLADSGSTGNSASLASTLFPGATTHSLPNIGYGAAANTAIRATQAPWLLLCNPDLTFPPDFAQKFLAPILRDPPQFPSIAQSTKIACLAPRLLNPDGSLQPSVGRFPTILSILRDQFRPRPFRKYVSPQPTAISPIDWATGACLLLNREAFLSINGFDKKYFLYMEEVDLQRRLHDAGFSTLFTPEATVTHLSPNASQHPRPLASRYAARGTLRYFAKFHSPLSLTAYRLLALLSGRLSLAEVSAPRPRILNTPTGP